MAQTSKADLTRNKKKKGKNQARVSYHYLQSCFFFLFKSSLEALSI